MPETIEKEVPHPLTTDGWMSSNDPEFSEVRSAHIAAISRASCAALTIARLLHNSLGEPDGQGAQPLGRGTELDLAQALICLGDYIFDKTIDMRQVSEDLQKLKEMSNG